MLNPFSYTFYLQINACYVLCPSHPHLCDRSNYVWLRVQVIKLLIMTFISETLHLLSRAKIPQSLVLKQRCLPLTLETSCMLIQNHRHLRYRPFHSVRHKLRNCYQALYDILPHSALQSTRCPTSVLQLRSSRIEQLEDVVFWEKMEAVCSTETSVLPIRRHIPEDHVLYCYRHDKYPKENSLRSYIRLTGCLLPAAGCLLSCCWPSLAQWSLVPSPESPIMF
jgi:hypothetical protein